MAAGPPGKNMIKGIFNILKRKLEEKKFKSRIKTKNCQIGKQTILLSISSLRELSRSKSYATKEPNTIKWIENYFKPGDVIYDIGANIGQYSLYSAKLLNSDCQIYAFEPEALNYAKLNINIKLNNLSECILAYPLALTNENKIDKFYINQFDFGQANHSFGVIRDYLNQKFNPSHTQGAFGITLDSLVLDYGLDYPNHIKVDVDGLERQVVEGGSKILADSRVKSVLIETTRYEGWEEREKWLVDFLKVRGMALADFEPSGRITQNLIFERK